MNLQIRAWDNLKKQWLKKKVYHLNPHFDENGFGEFRLNQHPEGYIIIQFTGALDKLKNKIFEGDIVLFDNPDPYDGQDQLTKIVGYNSRVMGFRLYNFTHEVDKYGGQVFLPEQVEVIGNIFEGAIKNGINYGEYLKEK